MVYPYYCSLLLCFLILFFFFKQKTAYEMRISDWSSDVCSSDLGRRSQAALNYINTTSYRHGKATELDISANLVGDSSQWFELPGGPVRFAIGAEYRRETASYAYDDLVSSGATFLNAIPAFNPPSFAVKEAYGEIDVPIFRDKPFLNELSVNGAARVADYKGSVGTVWAYNFGGIYSPIPDIKFRVNYSHSVRAPTLEIGREHV